jgi:hypothetical protein
VLLKDSTGVPIFFPMVPLRKPRTEFGLQPVIFTSSCKVTPPGCLSRSRILSVLLPPWGAVGGFFALAAFGVGSAFGGAALALRLVTRALVLGAVVAFLLFVFTVVILFVFLWRPLPRDDIDDSMCADKQLNC